MGHPLYPAPLVLFNMIFSLRLIQALIVTGGIVISSCNSKKPKELIKEYAMDKGQAWCERDEQGMVEAENRILEVIEDAKESGMKENEIQELEDLAEKEYLKAQENCGN